MKSLLFVFLVTAAPLLAADAPKIAVIPKGTTHVFWKSVEAGAQEAAKEAGAAMVWKGPLKENDRAQQIAIVEQMVADKMAGIVLAPLDDTALMRPVASAGRQKIPVVIFDSALKGQAGTDFVTLVATNNEAAGAMGGNQAAKLLSNAGKVVVLRYQVGSASTTEREAGFLEAVKAQPGLSVLADNRFAGATAAEAKTAAMNMLDKIREADLIFTPNESSTFGMLLALRQAGLAGKKKFVGFDASPPLIDALKKGEINALVVQNPRRMGSEAVKALLAHLRGETVPPRIDSGAALVTLENLETPEIKAMIGE